MSFTITGTGYCVPEHILTNDGLAGLVDTSDEWIISRTGIRERRVSTGETLRDLSVGAGTMAMDAAGVGPGDIDLIICATIEGDFLTPSLACLVQRALGATCPAFDVNAACSGFVYGLDIAAAYLETKRARRVLVIGAEMMSRHLDYSDRNTCVLFGDGSGAVVLESGEGLLALTLTARGDDTNLAIQSPPGDSPFNKTPSPYSPGVKMSGGEVYKFAVNTMSADVRRVLEKAGLAVTDIARFLPHQANERIIRAVMKNTGFTKEQTAMNVERYGNTSAASVAILFAEQMRDGLIKKGDLILMAAMGGGLTSGACVIKV